MLTRGIVLDILRVAKVALYCVYFEARFHFRTIRYYMLTNQTEGNIPLHLFQPHRQSSARGIWPTSGATWSGVRALPESFLRRSMAFLFSTSGKKNYIIIPKPLQFCWFLDLGFSRQLLKIHQYITVGGKKYCDRRTTRSWNSSGTVSSTSWGSLVRVLVDTPFNKISTII